MFSWNADDPNANEPIQIMDTSYAAFELFMDVLYFGTVPSNSEMFLEMIVLADKYDIPDIKAAIEASAIILINSDNVINMLITSELHKAQRMKKVALEFCAKNPMTEISNVQDLAKYPDLMVQVLTYNQKHFKKA
ncbi:speckle-type POZ protein-like A [Bradysia coprophila]|uniref:speckle-type POZ protein-like A n=1 Tax=Bradysia coprophila TaxID=38358 RepID=UPI00187DD77E|nr:speckle-type POZ protein-like A [Bradysia coprophila]